MKFNSYRYHLGLWFRKNDKKVEVNIHGEDMIYSYQHTLHVADSDSIYRLAEDVAEMRFLNDATWNLYNFVIFDMRKQREFPVVVKLDARDPKLWKAIVNVNGLDIVVKKKRHVVEQDSVMIAEIGPNGRYELKEKEK